MTKKNMTRLELLMDAGNGAQKAGDILIKGFAKKGHYVFIEPLIPAEISPPKRTPHSLSGAVIRVGEDELTNIGSYTDFVLVEHEILLKKRLSDKEFSKDCIIFIDMAESKRFSDDFEEVIAEAEAEGYKVIRFNMHEDALATIKALNGNGKNMYYLGMMTKLFEMQPEEIETVIRATFRKLSEDKLNQNIGIFKLGYDGFAEVYQENISIPERKIEGDKVLLDGNTAMALGIIDAGIKLFSGYPITPASTIMHNLAKLFPQYGGMIHQAEDEISAIGTAIGSYFVGVPSVTATSGPGLSLKQEFIGLATGTEVPCIIIDVQRAGPSTGLPTRTEQSDLYSAIYGAHGDNATVVLSVSNVEDCFYAPHVARYLTEKLRVPVFILSDYLTSVSYRILDKMPLALLQDKDVTEIPEYILKRFDLKPLPENIEMVKDNQSKPGEEGGTRRVTGLNTDEAGQVIYTSESDHRAHQVRNNKVYAVEDAMLEPEKFGDESGELLIVSWGSCRGVLQESITKAKDAGYSVGGLNLKIVYPIPTKHLKNIFSKYKKVVTIEVGYGHERKPAQLAGLLRMQTLVDVESAISNATGRPIKPIQVLEMIESKCQGVPA
ncbi:MAG: 2-oxoacid:acceptor oxidoreductase family protein [bacterium]